MEKVVMDILQTRLSVGRFSRTDREDGTGGRFSRTDKEDGTGGRFSRTDREDGTGVPSYILAGLLGSIKKFTARRINRLLDRSGTLWQDESYDHVIRDSDELERTIWYVLNNPVKAGLVDSWKKWSWTYCKPGFL